MNQPGFAWTEHHPASPSRKLRDSRDPIEVLWNVAPTESFSTTPNSSPVHPQFGLHSTFIPLHSNSSKSCGAVRSDRQPAPPHVQPELGTGELVKVHRAGRKRNLFHNTRHVLLAAGWAACRISSPACEATSCPARSRAVRSRKWKTRSSLMTNLVLEPDDPESEGSQQSWIG